MGGRLGRVRSHTERKVIEHRDHGGDAKPHTISPHLRVQGGHVSGRRAPQDHVVRKPVPTVDKGTSPGASRNFGTVEDVLNVKNGLKLKNDGDDAVPAHRRRDTPPEGVPVAARAKITSDERVEVDGVIEGKDPAKLQVENPVDPGTKVIVNDAPKESVKVAADRGPGTMTVAMYGAKPADLLNKAFEDLLSLELNESTMDARGMEDFAKRVATSVSEHYKEFSGALTEAERKNVEQIAKSSGIETKAAMIEYISNAYLFRAIRDYFDLPAQGVFPQHDSGGFLAFSVNGSIVASPPVGDSGKRTFHYSRMPSRRTQVETSSKNGELNADVAVGHRLKSSAFTTSPIQRLLYVPPEKADFFKAIQESALVASMTISGFVTQMH